MPQDPAKHKELLADINIIQEKLTECCDAGFLNDEAFRQLSKTNYKVYQMMEAKLRQMEQIKVIYTQSIYQSRWVKQYDPNYHKRQSDKKQHKLSHPENFYKCPCGEMLTCRGEDYDAFKKSRGGRNHLKTAKHADALMRLDWDKKGFCKKKHFDVAKMLFLNSHFSFKLHNHKGDKMTDKLRRIPKKHNNPVAYTIEQAIRRFNIKKMGEEDYIDNCEICGENSVLVDTYETFECGFCCKLCVSQLVEEE
tara:strand:+ start:578 stop:1330 length:753 start_codon:yes stop_codon:yes gene_type:complete